MKTAIVFGNDHTNSVGVIQSLGKAGYRSIGLVYGFKNDFVKNSRYVDCVITAKCAQKCIDKLINTDLGYLEKIPIIATCDMAALSLERNTDRLKDRFLFEHANNYSLEYLAKKENQVRMAIEAGFNVPKSWNLSDTKQIPNDVTYPCLIKPLVSCEGAKSDIRVCKTQTDLELNLNSLGCTKNVLLQQYIERDYEISILGCGLSTGNCLIPAIENKLTLYPKYVGLECLANLQPLEDGPIKRSIEKLVSSAGYVGLFSVEMMHCKKDNKFYFRFVNFFQERSSFLNCLFNICLSKMLCSVSFMNNIVSHIMKSGPIRYMIGDKTKTLVLFRLNMIEERLYHAKSFILFLVFSNILQD